MLPALNLQIGENSAQLCVDRSILSKVPNGRAEISPAMAPTKNCATFPLPAYPTLTHGLFFDAPVSFKTGAWRQATACRRAGNRR
jgi:hypothetical protein